MRFPDIPPRHRRLVRTVTAVGTAALALVRRRDVAAEHETALRFATSLANAGLTWFAGTRAFADSDFGELDLGGGRRDAGAPARYQTWEPTSEDELSPFEAEDARAKAFRNACVAAASGLVSWAAWTPAENIAEAIDAKLPAGLGRWLGAGASGGFVAVAPILIDRLQDLDATGLQDLDYAPVEIELPSHIRESVNLLLSQPHPVTQDTAEAVAEQLETARFFVWVDYPRAEYPGNERIVLDADQLAEVLRDEDIERIDVYPAASSPRVVPGTQTYPVVGIRDSADQDPGVSAATELSLSIVNGYVDAIWFSAPDSEVSVSDDLPDASVPGTLHPEGLVQESEDAGYSSSFEVFDEDDYTTVLATWPGPDQLSFRAEGS
ncbi:hypothetical protein [Brevibacterium spongiae]|uniref:Uncharacterized protein n=1 Tax=Brevibacterium spongiae TaxID=2909672 RepID=A0ABY5SSE8_9MICO|nr:hypothetical protein [Brevibacterium spongiae]UVI37055.1 hypothetical protein L1F31_05215 [Brevibacterium spongiae]